MASRPTIIVGTRGSKLALRQTELVVAKLREDEPALDIQIKQVKTQGDRDQRTSLAAIGGQGVFVKELERAILDGDIDVAVHSLKDVPAEVAPGLTLAGFPQRGDARDALVTKDGATLAELPKGARIGTGSGRRAAQLRALRPDVETADIRGNVDTRIGKVDSGEYDGVVLALVGLQRLGLDGRASQIFQPDELVPAVGQGAITIEARQRDPEIFELLTAISDEHTRLACEAERAFMARLGGGCRLPFGAYATVDGDELHIRGFVSDESGEHAYRGTLAAPVAEGTDAGTRLAEQLLNAGAAEFMVEAAS